MQSFSILATIVWMRDSESSLRIVRRRVVVREPVGLVVEAETPLLFSFSPIDNELKTAVKSFVSSTFSSLFSDDDGVCFEQSQFWCLDARAVVAVGVKSAMLLLSRRAVPLWLLSSDSSLNIESDENTTPQLRQYSITSMGVVHWRFQPSSRRIFYSACAKSLGLKVLNPL